MSENGPDRFASCVVGDEAHSAWFPGWTASDATLRQLEAGGGIERASHKFECPSPKGAAKARAPSTPLAIRVIEVGEPGI